MFTLTPLEHVFRAITHESSSSSSHELSSGNLLVVNCTAIDTDSDSENENVKTKSDFLIIWRDPSSLHVSISLCSNDVLTRVDSSSSSSSSKDHCDTSINKLATLLYLNEYEDNLTSFLAARDLSFPVAEAVAIRGSYLFLAAAPHVITTQRKEEEDEEEEGQRQRQDDLSSSTTTTRTRTDRSARLLVYDLKHAKTLLSLSSKPMSTSGTSLTSSSQEEEEEEEEEETKDQTSEKTKNLQSHSISTTRTNLSTKSSLTLLPCSITLTGLSLPAISINFAKYSSEIDHSSILNNNSTRIYIVSQGGETISMPFLEATQSINTSTTAKNISRYTLEPSTHSLPKHLVTCCAISSSTTFYQDPSLSLLSSLFDDASSLQLTIPKVTLFAGGSSPLFYSFNLSQSIDEETFMNDSTSLASHVSNALSMISESLGSPVLSGIARLFGRNNTDLTTSSQPTLTTQKTRESFQSQSHLRRSHPIRVLERSKESMESTEIPGIKTLFGMSNHQPLNDVSGGGSTSLITDFQTSSPDRIAQQIVVDSSQRYLAIATSDSRVILFNTNDASVLRIWKGQRNAQLIFLNIKDTRKVSTESKPILVIYTPLRGLITAWPIRAGELIGSIRVPKGGYICKCDGNVVMNDDDKINRREEQLFFVAQQTEGIARVYTVSIE
jgi:hypothetical protein